MAPTEPSQPQRAHADPRETPRGLLARCRTGEIMLPAPGNLRRQILLLLGVMLAGLVLMFGLRPVLLRHLDALRPQLQADPVAGGLALAQFVTLAFAPIVLILAVLLISEVGDARRAWRAGRWPLAHAKVQRRTAVIGGWCLKLRCILRPLLLAAALVLLIVTLRQLVLVFTDRALAHVSPHTSAAVTPRVPAFIDPRSPAQENPS